MIEYDKIFDDDSKFHFVIHPHCDPAREQFQFGHKLIVYLFEKRKKPMQTEIYRNKNKKANS